MQAPLNIPQRHKDLLKATLVAKRKPLERGVRMRGASAAVPPATGPGVEDRFIVAGYLHVSWLREDRIADARKGDQRFVVAIFKDETEYEHCVNMFTVCAAIDNVRTRHFVPG